MADRIATHDALSSFFSSIFSAAKVPAEIAAPVASGLIETSLRGVDSHGVRLFPTYIKDMEFGRTNPNPNFKFKQTAASTGILDANNTFGIAAGTEAMKHAMALAKSSGIGAVACINSNHFSAAAIYGLQAARENMIGIVVTQAETMVVPHGGKKPFLGTNPICFCAPMDGETPFCLDMATSIVPRNKVLSYKEKGKTLEPGWAADANGNPTTNPNNFASLFPIGAYKGYGLGLMVEILCSSLTGMSFGPNIPPFITENDKRKRNLGHFFIAIDISKFQDVSTFKRRLKEMAVSLRSSEPFNPSSPVLVAGDPEKKIHAERMKKGIPLTKTDVEKFRLLAEKYKVKMPEFLA